MYNETLAKTAAAIIFVGFNTTFFPQFVLGSQGMPRRYYNYIPQFEMLHKTSTVGSWILGVGFLLVAAYLVHSLIKGAKAPSNPWGARTLEWMSASPPPTENFTYSPVVTHHPYDFNVPLKEFHYGIAEEHTVQHGYHGAVVETQKTHA
jgi:cytochrome c oxidase subunit 1